MSSPDGAQERELLSEEFARVFPGTTIRPFGNRNRAGVGISDDNDGVQWNTGVELVNHRWTDYFLGVNLEGIEYNGSRPIAQLIRLELECSLIFDEIRKIRQPQEIQLRLLRDAWQAQSRPLYFTERFILDLPLAKLTEDAWKHALLMARDCFDARSEPARRQITFYDRHSGRPEIAPRAQLYKMTPHLSFRSVLWSHVPNTVDARVEAMRGARDRLQPLYDFTKKRAD